MGSASEERLSGPILPKSKRKLFRSLKIGDLKVSQSEPNRPVAVGVSRDAPGGTWQRRRVRNPGRVPKHSSGKVLQSLFAWQKSTLQKSERPFPMPMGRRDEGFADGRYVMLSTARSRRPADGLGSIGNSVDPKLLAQWLEQGFL